ncbi:MAG: ferritin-like domain-containing protein [Aggregatilineales bacterium]
MDLNNLRDTFHEQLKDIYSAEKQLTEALPKMVKSASDPKLQEAFQSHLDLTHRQLERVHTLLQNMDVNPGNKKCEAMEGLVKEGEEMAKKDGDPAACDAGLIAAAQKVEHYEIATYGSLRAWATALGEDEAAQVLQEILDEEYDADNTLDKLAEGYLNKDAVS